MCPNFLRVSSLVPQTQALTHLCVCLCSCGCLCARVCGRGGGGQYWENLSLNRSHVTRQTCWLLRADLLFPEPGRDRCCAGFEVGPMSLIWPVRNAWQLPASPQAAFRIARSVPGSAAQLPRASCGQQASSKAHARMRSSCGRACQGGALDTSSQGSPLSWGHRPCCSSSVRVGRSHRLPSHLVHPLSSSLLPPSAPATTTSCADFCLDLIGLLVPTRVPP